MGLDRAPRIVPVRPAELPASRAERAYRTYTGPLACSRSTCACRAAQSNDHPRGTRAKYHPSIRQCECKQTFGLTSVRVRLAPSIEHVARKGARIFLKLSHKSRKNARFPRSLSMHYGSAPGLRVYTRARGPTLASPNVTCAALPVAGFPVCLHRRGSYPISRISNPSNVRNRTIDKQMSGLEQIARPAKRRCPKSCNLWGPSYSSTAYKNPTK